MTTAYVFKDAKEDAARFDLSVKGNIYTRLTNPNNTSWNVEKRIAAIEGGTAAISTASGMAAISTLILALTNPGDEILSADNHSVSMPDKNRTKRSGNFSEPIYMTTA